MALNRRHPVPCFTRIISVLVLTSLLRQRALALSNVSSGNFTTHLPACAKDCALSSLSSITSEGEGQSSISGSDSQGQNCTIRITDIPCLCSSSDFLQAFSTCVSHSCSSEDQKRTNATLEELCGKGLTSSSTALTVTFPSSLLAESMHESASSSPPLPTPPPAISITTVDLTDGGNTALTAAPLSQAAPSSIQTSDASRRSTRLNTSINSKLEALTVSWLVFAWILPNWIM